MNTTVNCTKCKKEVDSLEVFPKGLCLDCHAEEFVMPTAEELVRMWGGKA